MRILHISADFPDPLAPNKTRCVANLLELAPEHDHMVYSLNRVSWRRGVTAAPFGRDWRAVAYGAPPRGLMLKRGLDRVAAFVIEDAQRRGLKPDLVHGHKLSVEGPIAAAVARALGVPYVLASMGDTDLKILDARRDLRPMWRTVWRGAAAVTPSAPWALAGLEARLGPRGGPVGVLPLPTMQDALRAPTLVGPAIRTTFHLASWRRKNVLRLIAAAAKAARRMPDLRLDIVGGGDADGYARIAEAAQAADPARIRALGPIPHERMGDFVHASGGFALPSLRETYGMVYVEALLSGVPVMHSTGWGIAGFLQDESVCFGVAAQDVDEIAAGLERLARDEAAMKTRLAALQASGGLELFRRTAVAETYRALLRDSVAAPRPA